MIAYGGNGGTVPHILNLGIRWRTVYSLTPGRFTPRERVPIMHSLGGRVGLSSGPVVLENRKISFPCQEANQDSLILQHVLQQLY